MKEVIIFEDCDNGIYMNVTQFPDDGTTSSLVYENENKAESLGQFLMKDIKRYMSSHQCSRVKITVDIEPVKDL